MDIFEIKNIVKDLPERDVRGILQVILFKMNLFEHNEILNETDVWGEREFLIYKLTDLGKGTYRKLTNLHVYQEDNKKLT